MGDYTKLIVSCQVNAPEDELKEKINNLSLGSSAYHSQETVKHIQKSTWHHRGDRFDLVLVGQTKWGKGQTEFLNWLQPFVVAGSGERGIFATQIWEEGDPQFWSLQ